MNPSTLAKITIATPFLCTAVARQSEPYLESFYRLSLKILAALTDGQGRTCQEIADLIPPTITKGRNGMDIPSPDTVNQVLLALQKGGVVFVRSEGAPLQRTWKLPQGKASTTKANRKH